MKSFKDALQNRTFDQSLESQAKFVDEQKRKAKIYSQDDLDAATKTAKTAGMEAGFQQAQQDILGQTNATLKILSEQFSQIKQDFDHASKEAESIAASIALTTLQKLMPHVIKNKGTDEIRGFVETIIREHLSSTVLKVHVHPTLAATIEQHLTTSLSESGVKKSLQVIADPAISAAACWVEWDKGGYKKDLEVQFQHLLKVFADQGISTMEEAKNEVPQG